MFTSNKRNDDNKPNELENNFNLLYIFLYAILLY